MRLAGLGDEWVRLDFTAGVEAGRREGICDFTETLDRGTDICVDRQVPSKQQGLRAKPGFQQGDDPHRHDHPHATNARKTNFRQLKTYPENELLEIKVNCKNDAGKITSPTAYGLAVSLEVAEGTGLPVYNEVRNRIRSLVPVRPTAD